MDKAESQYRHAIRRAIERYDLFLSKKDYNEMVRLIQKSNCETLYRMSNRRSMKSILWQGQRLYLVYDNDRNTIASFLKEHMVNWNLVEKNKREIQEKNILDKAKKDKNAIYHRMNNLIHFIPNKDYIHSENDELEDVILEYYEIIDPVMIQEMMSLI